MSLKSDWYQQHLNRVSRSFAFGISELQEPLREYVGFAYLFCRLIDTIEDSGWARVDDQKKQFVSLTSYLDQCPSEETFSSWKAQMPEDLPEGERILLADSYRLIEDYHALPSKIQEILRGPLRTMIRGMSKFVEVKSQQGIRLGGILELNHYCFFVAGIVGEILTRLMSHLMAPHVNPAARQILSSFHFGLFLQKVNILKDQEEDLQRGIRFFEHRDSVVRSLRTHALRAKEYLLSVPEAQGPFRVFCAFSFALGLLSLPHILGQSGNPDKITRDQTKTLMTEIKKMEADPQEMSAALQLWIDQLPTAESQSPSGSQKTSQAGSQTSRFDPEFFYEGVIDSKGLSEFFREI